ncbi:polysaccharide deacetylase family protein [Natronobiforma cellulositropha]|uniref:hypothetical protein n=1 Tax=Natronobiforma cellulositropha TaxID=1679076 RepID=UPI0021D60EA2|nr:hypothetical protein [Natronobiforma cellulositropha]
MNVRDFTFDAYERFLQAATENDFEVLTVASYLQRDEPPERFVLLRHDVDRKLDIAYSMAQLEARYDVSSTYYFRTSTFDPDLVGAFEGFGHEVGYHYEELARANGDVDLAYERFERTLEAFRRHATIETACSHGSPLSPHRNLDMWDEERPPESFDLLGEAYLSVEKDDEDPTLPSYCSDTGRRWGLVEPGFGLVETTADLVSLLESGACDKLYVLAHPGRWSRTGPEFVERVAWDVAAEAGKRAVGPVHQATQQSGSIGADVTQTLARSVAVSRQLAGATIRWR